MEGYCALYRIEGGIGVCSDRGSHLYLSGCVVWPTLPHQIAEHPSCSFKFEKVS